MEVRPCRQWEERLTDVALGGAYEPALEAHLTSCQACAAALETLRARASQLDETLRNMAAAEPPAGLADRIMLGIEERPAPRWNWRLALAGVVLSVALIVMLDRRATQPPAPDVTTAISQWRSPTESLLRSHSDSLFSTIPRFGEKYGENNGT